jgi:hypothetical protein
MRPKDNEANNINHTPRDNFMAQRYFDCELRIDIVWAILTKRTKEKGPFGPFSC